MRKYKLRIYKIKGPRKGDLDHEEFFETLEDMQKRYKEISSTVRNILPDYEAHSYFPTAWDPDGNRMGGY